ncbi:MAG TPA: sucrase ferredoxin [Cyanobacteria bacterium UBA8543]|nr:sucrase ferredoxin [Cyanobacteria bacterium UBA8543]
MILTKTSSNCRFCSILSKANGEDPIGSADYCDRWLIIELAPPWVGDIWLEAILLPQGVIDSLKLAWESGLKLLPIAIAPDREYSHPNFTRVLYYRRVGERFAQFEKQEFVIPHPQLGSLVTALVEQPEGLSHFDTYRQETAHIRELLVCTDGNVDVACARFGYPIYRTLRQEYAVASGGRLRVWRCSHFGGHQFAPTLADFPQGRFWGHLELEMLHLLVQRQGSVLGLRPFYRGWSGLSRFEQIAEREMLMQEGWAWLDYQKVGQVLAMDSEAQTWAEVRIDFTALDGSVGGAYEARIEANASVTTALWSSTTDDDEPLVPVKQYRVSRLVKVA